MDGWAVHFRAAADRAGARGLRARKSPPRLSNKRRICGAFPRVIRRLDELEAEIWRKRMRTSLARTVSAAVVTLAGPANAAPVSPRVHTTLSIVESRNVIKAGQKDVISGRLASRGIGLGEHVVYLDRIEGKLLVAVQAEVTGPHGGVSFTVRPHVTARYELVYRGNKTFAPTHSGVVTVKVKH